VADAPTEPQWRDIHALGALVGAYCWMEQRVFAIAGGWAGLDGEKGAGAPELRLWCAATSRRHGVTAGRWAERLPVRAGVDPEALIAAPPGPLALQLDSLAGETHLARGVAALVDGLLPGIAAIYDTHRRTASPVSEAPVLEVLTGAHRDVVAEIRGGRTLMGGQIAAEQGQGVGVTVRQTFERLLNGIHVFPAVRTS
jgi:hypothetical protein